MRPRSMLVLAVLVLQAAALSYLYRGCGAGGSDLLGNFLETRRETGGGDAAALSGAPQAPMDVRQKYVLDPQDEVAALMRAPEYAGLDAGRRRIKLVEYFTLHVADADYSLLPEEEQKAILREFMRRYDSDQ